MARTIATTTAVDREQMLAFVRPRHHFVLMTYRRDGTVQSSPVTGGVDPAGRLVVSSYPDRAKTANIRRSGRAGVLVLSDDFDGAWLQADGEAEVLDMPDALDGLVDYFRSISGEHPDWEDYRRAMRRQDKVLLRVTPTRWGPVATGGFPARLAGA